MGPQSKHELAEAVRPRYQRVSRAERGRILDEFCAATGYHRVYARWLLRRQGVTTPRRGARPGRRARYGPLEVELLRICWVTTDQICGKRLAPFLGELLDKLEACGVLPEATTADALERVRHMSAATIDRLLAAEREPWPRRGLGTTKPGTLLKGQVPIKTFADWDDARPGFLEVDLVAHCGATGAGEFLFTLSTVDVATGWSACVGVRNKGEAAVFAALTQLRHELPFPLLGLDSDNGSEFLNHSLVRYCVQEGITFTRSRPYQKNDSCHIEQKNWSVVRRLVGYARFEGAALPALNRVHALAHAYVNFWQPVQKLVHKTRDGARVRKTHDRAQTPYRRLLASGILSAAKATDLADRYQAINPVLLKLDLEAAQQALYQKTAQADPKLRMRKNISLREPQPPEGKSL